MARPYTPSRMDGVVIDVDGHVREPDDAWEGLRVELPDGVVRR